MLSSSSISVAFLFGSGVSRPAGMPSTDDVTTQVLSGDGFRHHSSGEYYRRERTEREVDELDEYVPRILVFLNRLRVEIDKYYFPTWRATNYEDLYYMATQIEDSLTGEYDNPAVQPLIEKILPDIEPFLIGKKYETKREWGLDELAREAKLYIRDVVCRMLLEREPSRTEHLDNLKDACLDGDLSRIDIFTLNHDTVLEQCLSKSDVKVIDGFGETDNNVRYWKPDLFESKSSKVRFFKLHGSVNWFRLRPNGGDRCDDRIGIPRNGDRDHTRDPHGRPQSTMEKMVLVGTFNKMFQYSSSIYAELHYQFYRSLPRLNNWLGSCEE